ncbi:unnamed protein product [Prunus armeniaca]
MQKSLKSNTTSRKNNSRGLRSMHGSSEMVAGRRRTKPAKSGLKITWFRRLERRPMSGKGRIVTPGLSRSFWHRSRPHPWPVAGVAREEGDGCREEREREREREGEKYDFYQTIFAKITIMPLMVF